MSTVASGSAALIAAYADFTIAAYLSGSGLGIEYGWWFGSFHSDQTSIVPRRRRSVRARAVAGRGRAEEPSVVGRVLREAVQLARRAVGPARPRRAVARDADDLQPVRRSRRGRRGRWRRSSCTRSGRRPGCGSSRCRASSTTRPTPRRPRSRRSARRPTPTASATRSPRRRVRRSWTPGLLGRDRRAAGDHRHGDGQHNGDAGRARDAAPPESAHDEGPLLRQKSSLKIDGFAAEFLKRAPSPAVMHPGMTVCRRRIVGTLREVAQLGSAPALGAGGRGFKSRLPDHVRPGVRAGSVKITTWTCGRGSGPPNDATYAAWNAHDADAVAAGRSHPMRRSSTSRSGTVDAGPRRDPLHTASRPASPGFPRLLAREGVPA